MAVISRVTTWSDGQVLTASALNGEFNNILTDYNGGITNANISASAAIDSTKISGTAVTLAGTETLTNKTLTDSTTYFQDNSDNTKKVQLQLSGITTGNTRTLTVPDASTTLVGTDTTQTLTSKTLTTPTITKPVMSATNPSAETYTPSAAGTATLDLSLSNEHRITMPAGNITIALSNDTNAQKFIVSITQDSGGSRTVTWFSTIKWPGGVAPTLTTTANKRDVFGFIRTGSGTYDGFIIGQNL